jgi:hypothetical protein
MATRSEILRELFVENGLVKDEDTFDLKFGSRTTTIITRSGIEKIQYHNKITVEFKEVSMEPDFVVVKAVAYSQDPNDRMESYGEASPQNTTQKYPVAMAEKRALSRVILKVAGFYKYNVMGQDESDDFKREQE